MDSHSHRIIDDFPRRLIRRFEGGAVYESERNGKFLVIEDQGTLLDLLNEEDRAEFEPVIVYEFETAAERKNFLNQRGWVTRMTTEQHAFLDAQIFSMSLMATVQRNKYLYAKDASDDDKKTFRGALRTELQRLAEQYVIGISELQHVANIVSLADNISVASPKALAKGRFKIGAAQKALNLYLKYMWCLGRIPMPPHCPFDSIVLSKIGCKSDKWTEVVDIDKYINWTLLAKAEAKANETSLAEWELHEYNKALPGAASGALRS